MRRWLLYFTILLLIFNCSRTEQKKVIPKRDLVSLLVDIHIHDAIAMNYNINEQFGGLDSAILYSTVLDSYGYSKEDFIRTIEHYTKDPEKLIKVYDDVFSELSKRAEETKTLYETYSTRKTKLIWKPKIVHYRIYGDTASYPAAFEITIDTSGTYVLSTEIKMTKKDQSKNPRIVAYFYNASNDNGNKRLYFDETSFIKSNFKREYTLVKECDSKEFDRIRIIIPEYENKDESFFKDLDISNLRVSLVKPEKKK